MIAGIAKRLRIAVAVVLTSIFVCAVGLTLTACSPQDIKYDKAIEIAKKDFGCEKILWIQSGALILETGQGEEIPVYSLRSHYAYYVVGEKNGREIYIVVPSSPDLDKPYTAAWGLDYSFAQIVEKFNENGAQYVADVPDDYYRHQGNYIRLIDGNQLNGLDEYYDVGGDDQAFSNRLDVKAAFEYAWEADDYRYSCIVTQENGELKAYKQSRAI